MVLKLEREVYQTNRPRQLAKRDIFLRIGEPSDLSRFIPAYLRDARAVRHCVAEQLRDRIQVLIDTIAIPTHDERMGGRKLLEDGQGSRVRSTGVASAPHQKPDRSGPTRMKPGAAHDTRGGQHPC